MKTTLFKNDGKRIKDMQIEETVFGVTVNEGLVHQVVKAQLACARRGTASTKSRAEVQGGGRKPWRQKGTGRARAGSSRSPLWKGGGVVFGPKPRDYGQKVPRKMKNLALKSVLSDKAMNDGLIVVDKYELDKPSTKSTVEFLKTMNISGKVTMIVANNEDNVIKSVRNIPNARAISVAQLNIYDLVDCDKLLMTKEAIDKVTEVLSVAKR